jgi:hypothetical protein
MSMRISLRVLLLLTQLMGILELRGQAPPAPRLDEVSVLPFPAARKQAVEEARVKAARLAEEAEMKARQPF